MTPSRAARALAAAILGALLATTAALAAGSGDFVEAPDSPFGAGTNPRSVAVGHFDGDDNQDLAVSNRNSSDVTILLGDGAGGFDEPETSPEDAGSPPSSWRWASSTATQTRTWPS